jgi:hypothetical protein
MRLKAGSKVHVRLRDLHRVQGSGKFTFESQRSLTCLHSVHAFEEREAAGMAKAIRCSVVWGSTIGPRGCYR